MNFLPAAKIIYFVIASTLSVHHDLGSACARKEGRVVKIESLPQSTTLNLLYCPNGCPPPPDVIEATEIKCVLVKETRTKKETVEVVPEHWETQ